MRFLEIVNRQTKLKIQQPQRVNSFGKICHSFPGVALSFYTSEIPVLPFLLLLSLAVSWTLLWAHSYPFCFQLV